MKIIWSPNAKENFYKILEYWELNNGNTHYSDKIIEETKKNLLAISNKPLFLGRYSKKLNLYVRPILKGKFAIYFDVNENINTIEIVHFRSSKQNTIE